MNVSKLAPFAKAIVAAAGSLVTIVLATSAIASLFLDGVITNDEALILFSNATIIAAALGLPVAVYKVPNKNV